MLTYYVCSRCLMVRVEIEGSRVRGLIEYVSWPCFREQVKDWFHVVIWAACKRTHNQYETSCGYRPHPRECLYASGSISNLSIRPDYQYKFCVQTLENFKAELLIKCEKLLV